MATDGGGPDLGVGDDGEEVDVRALAAEVRRLRARQDRIVKAIRRGGDVLSGEMEALGVD